MISEGLREQQDQTKYQGFEDGPMLNLRPPWPISAFTPVLLGRAQGREGRRTMREPGTGAALEEDLGADL